MGIVSSKKILEEINTMYEMLNDVEEFSEDQVTSKTTEIKKLFNHYTKEHGKNNTLNEKRLEPIRKALLSRYKDVKSYASINEVLDKIALEYEGLIDEYESEGDTAKVTALRKFVLGIRSKTLGNPGSHPEKCSAAELEKVIRAKTDSTGINNTEIINILQACVGKSDEYQALVQNIVMPVVESNLKKGEPKIVNADILTVMKEYALGYLLDGDKDKCREIINKGLELKVLEKTPQYQELRNAYPKEEATAIKPDEMKKNGFEEVDISELNKIEDENELFETFFNKLKILPNFAEIFVDKGPVTPREKKSKGTKSSNIIPKEIKLRNIFNILREVQKKYPNTNITKAFVGKDAFLPKEGEKNTIKSFENYVIFEIDNAGYSILESFDDKKEGGLFVIPTESLPKYVAMKRTDAKKSPDVDFFTHDNLTPGKYKYVTEAGKTISRRMALDLSKNTGKTEPIQPSVQKTETKPLEPENNQKTDIRPSKQDENPKLDTNPQKSDDKPEAHANSLDDMSTQELMDYLSNLDNDIQETQAENAKIRQEMDETLSAEEKFRKDLIERIKGKQTELQQIREEQHSLRKILAERQQIMNDAKKRFFGNVAPSVDDDTEGQEGH